MLQNDTEIKTQITFVRAVLVTGKDADGHEFAYSKSGDSWVDLYNACEIDAKYIQDRVFPNVVYARYDDYKMGRAEWLGNGCPLDLSRAHVDLMQDMERHPAAVAYEQEHKDWLDEYQTRESERPF